MPTASSTLVPTSPNAELAAAQEKISRVEEALRTKTLQWQELHSKFEQLQQRLQEAQGTSKHYWAQILALKDDVKMEQNFSAGLRKTNEQLEEKIRGRPAPLETPELRRERLIRDMKDIAAKYGEEDAMYKKMQKELDRMLNAQAEDVGVHKAEQARLDEIKGKETS